MSSVTRDIAQTILKNNGTHPGDQQCYAVYLYRDVSNGGDTFKVCYDAADEINFRKTELMDGTPVLLWHRNISGAGLSAAGQALVDEK